MPGRGVQGGNPAGGTNLVGAARRALGQSARIFARTPLGFHIAMFMVMLMIESRVRCRGDAEAGCCVVGRRCRAAAAGRSRGR